MQYNNLEYTIDSRNIREGHIQLNARDENGNVLNSYPVVYSITKEVDEMVDTIKENKHIEEFIDTDEEGNDFINKKIVTTQKTIMTPTGNKIPNPDYLEPQSLKEIEEWILNKKDLGFSV